MKRTNLKQLSAYLADTGGYVSGGELAHRFHTTTRTIRNYVAEINASFDGPPLIVSSRRGYRWNTEDNAYLAPYVPRPHPQSPDERRAYIIRQLLYHREVSYYQLLDALFVSDSALDMDLARIKAILRAYDLRLHRRGDRLFLHGAHLDRRSLILRTILSTTQASVISLSFIQDSFPEFDVAEICRRLENAIRSHQLATDGETLYELLLYVIIQLQQISLGNQMEARELEYPGLESYVEYGAAVALADSLQEAAGITFNDCELEQLALLLIAKTMPRRLDTRLPGTICALLPVVEELLPRLSPYLRPEFLGHESKLWFADYLQRVVLRRRLNLTYPYPMQESFRLSHPLLYKVSADCLFTFSQVTGHLVLPNEILPLALLIATHAKAEYASEEAVPCAVVCPVQASLADDMLSALQEKMGDVLDIHQVLSTPDVETIEDGVTLILSTIPLRNRSHVVPLTPLLQQEDFWRIHQEVQQIKTEGYATELKLLLSRYLSDSGLYYQVSARSHQELLHAIGSDLIDSGTVDEGYLDCLMDRESFETSTYGGPVALPFLSHPSVKRDQVIVATAKSYIAWGSEKVSLAVLLVCRDPDNQDFRTLFYRLVKVLGRPGNARLLRDVQSKAELLAALEELR